MLMSHQSCHLISSPIHEFSFIRLDGSWALLGLLSGLDQLKKFNHPKICGLIPLISQKCKLFRGQTKLSLMNLLGKRKNFNTTEIQQNHLHVAVAAQAWSISWAMSSVQNFGIDHESQLLTTHCFHVSICRISFSSNDKLSCLLFSLAYRKFLTIPI